MSFETKNFLPRTLLERLPEMERSKKYFPKESCKSIRGLFEFEHKKNIFGAVQDETKFTEDQKSKCVKVIEFLEKKDTEQDEDDRFRTKELNVITNKPEPKINHPIRVAERLIQFVLAGRSTKVAQDKAQNTQKFQDLELITEDHLYIGSIAALLHDVIEDGLATVEEVGELLDSINVTPENKQRILKIIDFLTIRERESVDAYFDRIEQSSSENDIAATLAKLIKICDIEANAESEHSNKQRMKYGNLYIPFLIQRFEWVNALLPRWMKDKILKENEYLKDEVNWVSNRTKKTL